MKQAERQQRRGSYKQDRRQTQPHSYDKRPTYLRAGNLKAEDAQMGAARKSVGRRQQHRDARGRDRTSSRVPEGKPKGSRHRQAIEDDAESISMVEPHRLRHRTLELMVAAEARGSSGSAKSLDHLRAGARSEYGSRRSGKPVRDQGTARSVTFGR